MLVASTAPAQAQGDGNAVVVESPRQITGGTDPTRLFNVPSLAVNPDDPSTVVMASGDTRNGGCGLWVSGDGGLSWERTVETLLPEGQDFCIQRPRGDTSHATFADDGTLYVSLGGSATETGHPNGPIALFVARSDDGGQTAETATVATADRITLDPADFGNEGDPVEGNLWHKFSRVAADPSNPDRLYVGWRWGLWGLDLQAPESSLPFRPYLATSDDGGQTWSEAVDLLSAASVPDGYGGSAALPVVGPDGTVYAFSEESLPSPAEGETRPPSGLLMFTSSDGGATWESTVVNDGNPAIEIAVPAIDPDTGDLSVVYAAREQTEDDEADAPSEVYYTGSRDGGATWSDPINITDDDPARGGGQFLPGIDIAPNGRIDVAWYDFRNDSFTGGSGEDAADARYWDVYASSSTDGGASWSPNVRVTETVVDGSEGVTFANSDTRGPMGIASADQATYVAWSDSRPTGSVGSAEDVYFSRLRYAEVSPLGAEAGEGSWTMVALGAGAALALAGLLFLLFVRGAGRTAKS